MKPAARPFHPGLRLGSFSSRSIVTSQTSIRWQICRKTPIYNLYEFHSKPLFDPSMTSMTKCGRKSDRTPLVKKEHEEGMPGIPGSLSTVYSGYCVLEYPGGTCRKRMETGKMYTAGCASGVTRESRERFWRLWWMTPTLSG